MSANKSNYRPSYMQKGLHGPVIAFSDSARGQRVRWQMISATTARVRVASEWLTDSPISRAWVYKQIHDINKERSDAGLLTYVTTKRSARHSTDCCSKKGDTP